MKTVFTTGEAAKICKVSRQTIIRCFDSGQLKGFRVPGSRFRRIPRDQLFSFMKDNGIPTEALESGKRKVLIVDDDVDLVDLMRDAFERDGRFEIRTANNGFDAGMGVKEFRPDLVILDVNYPATWGTAELNSAFEQCASGWGIDESTVETEFQRGLIVFIPKGNDQYEVEHDNRGGLLIVVNETPA